MNDTDLPQKVGGGLVKGQSADHYKNLKRWCTEQRKNKRPESKLVLLLNTGNRWGEKRIFRYLEEYYKPEDLILVEGAEVGEFDVKQGLFKTLVSVPNDTKSIKEDQLKMKEYVKEALKAYAIVEFLSNNRDKVLSMLKDIEDDGKDLTQSFFKDDLSKYSGISAVEAFGILNDNAKIYGLEDSELYIENFKAARKASSGVISHDMFGTKQEKDNFYDVARLRSEVMCHHCIEAMDAEKAKLGHVCLTGFHAEWFREVGHQREISIEEKLVTNLPKLNE